MYHFPGQGADRSFITDLTTSADAGAIAAAVIAMAHALQKRVVAEGVERQQQAALLSRLGCDHMQGYYFSEPLPAGKFAAFARTAAGAQQSPPSIRVAVA